MNSLFTFISLLSVSFLAQVAYAQKPVRCEDRILVSAIGDVLVHDALQVKAHGTTEKFYSIWSQVTPYIQVADVSYANLEGPVAPGVNKRREVVPDVGFRYDRDVYSGTNFLFNFHPQVITDLQKLGIDIVSTANNHSMDRGSVGIDRTVDELNKKNMAFSGMRKKGSQADWGVVTQVKGKEIFWLACAENLNGFKDPHNQVLKCYENEQELTQIVKDAIKNYDAVIVTPHWGDEYKQIPNQRQRAFARKMAGLGVTAIVGNHPHVLQPVELIGNTLVAYSLGNFAAYQKDVERKTTAVLYLDLRVSLESGKLKVYNMKALPVYRDATTLYPAISKLHPAALAYVSKHFGQQNIIFGQDIQKLTDCQ